MKFVKGNKINLTHGMRHTRQYNTWNHMLSRCNRKKDKKYKFYGGRGIKVCRRWLSFINFWNDMKDGYSDNLTLDRIDVNGSYCKKNCRWSTGKEQQRNRRDTVVVNNGGSEVALRDLCEEIKIPYHRVYLRLFRYNWPLERALTN